MLTETAEFILDVGSFQTRDAILKGSHPVTQDEAYQFAGLQCQIQFGDHNEQRHRSGFIE